MKVQELVEIGGVYVPHYREMTPDEEKAHQAQNPPLTPLLLREQAYESEPTIRYGNAIITVDDANKLFAQYFAEGSAKAAELSALISEAKAKIRAKYPDNG